MANVVLENVSQDEMNWYHESRYWMHVSDELSAMNAAKRKGKAEGLVQGKTESKKEIARNLLSLKSLSLEEISKVTGLSTDELCSIQNSL